jgi:hypothetical protein
VEKLFENDPSLRVAFVCPGHLAPQQESVSVFMPLPHFPSLIILFPTFPRHRPFCSPAPSGSSAPPRPTRTSVETASST